MEYKNMCTQIIFSIIVLSRKYMYYIYIAYIYIHIAYTEDSDSEYGDVLPWKILNKNLNI